MNAPLWYPFGAAAAGAVVGGALLYVIAPSAIDRDAYTRVERGMLAQVEPYPGARSSDVRTTPDSSSDWGISILNPPETYLTSRTDSLPAGSSVTEVAHVYQRELHRAGPRVSRFEHQALSGQAVEVDGQRGAELITTTITNHTADLTARCERNGPFLPKVLEPPCGPTSVSRLSP